RMQFLGENDALQRSALLASLQAICAEIERDPSTPAPAKFQSKLIVMWAEGATRRLGLLRARMEAQARNEVFGGGVASPEWTKARESLADWERLVDTALGDAER